MNVLEAITYRRSVRAYDSRPIEPESYQRLLQSLRFAPSACNYQPWRFVLVADEQLRGDVAEACNGQAWMAQAPLIVVACGMPERAYPKMAGRHNSVEIDIAISLDHLSLAAIADGLGTCWIGAFNEPAVKQLLNVPDAVRVIALMPVGYPAKANLNHPLDESKRKKPEEIFLDDRYAD